MVLCKANEGKGKRSGNFKVTNAFTFVYTHTLTRIFGKTKHAIESMGEKPEKNLKSKTKAKEED